MRLRLTVRRHNLPDTRVLWNIDTSSAPTICQLLEQVNEAIPIESEDWGLEDYAVESNGFECIHYKGVEELFKEDEEVVIKPLTFRDLKVRRISGRHQITSDGKHLVDGVPFGKPLLRQPAHRPEIRIPPRKRARLTMTEDEDDDEGFAALMDMEEGDMVDDDAGKQLVLHADFDDDDSEDDEDFTPAVDGDDEDKDEEEFALEDDESSDDDLNEEEVSDGEVEATQQHPEHNDNSQTEEVATKDNNEEALEGINDNAVRAEIRKLQSAFPDATLAVCRHVHDGAHGDMVVSWEALSQGFKAAKPKSSFAKTLQEVASPSASQAKSRKRSAVELESEDDEEEEESRDPFLKHYDENGFPPGSISSGRALSVMAEAIKSSPDRRPQPKASSTTSKSIKFPLDEELSKGLTSTPLLDKDSDKDESEDDSDDSSEDTSSSGSDSSSDEETDNVEAKEDDISSSGSDSDSDSSDSESDADVPKAVDTVISKSANVEDEDTSSSESESESDDGSHKAGDKVVSKSNNGKVGDEDTSSSESESVSATSSDSSSDDESPEEVTSKLATALSTATKKSPSKPTVPPSQGLNKTQMRNQRRQKANKLQRFKEKGILPQGTTLEEFKRIQLKEESTAEEGLAALSAVRTEMLAEESERTNGQALAKTDEFERRRQQLLASLASGGVEVGQSSQPSSPAEASQPEPSSSETSNELVIHQDEAKVFSTAPETFEQKPSDAPKDIDMEEARPSTAPAPTDAPLQSPKPQPASVDSSQVRPTRRPKIDLGAATRMLFGNLGRRAPKTKEDAEKLKKDMMKDAKPVWVPKPAEEPVADASESEDDDSWREKIIYRAVECCHDGIELSEPPFPFEQRWDPQQKPQSMKRLRNQSQYYDDSQPLSKKQRKRMRKNEDLEASYNSSFQDTSVNVQEDSQMTAVQNDEEGQINQQLLNDLNPPNAEVSQGPDDLMALPEDPSTLPQLEDGKAKIGMTIAFKQLTFSAETNWQPVMSPYRTAIVVMIRDNGDLDLRLAVRDRAQKSYDEETGERIYGKYDMPVDDEEEDDGSLELSFAELVEPKIVAPPPANTEQDSFMDEASQVKDGPSADESVTLSHEREEETAEAQLSHVTETPLNSDAPDPNQKSVEVVVSEDVAISVEDPQAKDPASVPTTPLNADVMETEGVRTIKKIFKDQGFHSSVPRVVLDDLRPNGTKTPGDQAVFDKLRKDMEAVEGYFSPAFNGFGSSPSRERPECSNSPDESQNLPSALGSSPPKQSERLTTPEVREPSQKAPSSSPQPPPSSWQTVDSQEDTLTSQQKPIENTSSWVTVPDTASSPQPAPEVEQSHEPEEKVPTPQPTPKKSATPRQTPKKAPAPKPEEQKTAALVPAKPKSIKKVPRRTLGKAQQMWEQFQPTTPAGPTIKSRNESPDPFGLDGLDERDSNTSVEYPKLSLGSSFSQVSDYGRQPDYNFDDSTTTHVETPKVAGLDVDEGAATDVEPELPNHQSTEEDFNLDQPDDSVVMEPELPARKPVVAAPRVPSDDDSDSSLPPLEVVFSQQSVKKEKTPVRSKAATKAKPMAVLDESSDEDTTPKPSQKQRQTSHQSRQSRPSQRASQPNASQPRASQPRATQSQVVDLTLTSSDVEPESEKATRFRKYELSDDDEDYDDGRAAKKPKGGRSGNVGLKDSSQTSLNKNRRKTVAR